MKPAQQKSRDGLAPAAVPIGMARSLHPDFSGGHMNTPRPTPTTTTAPTGPTTGFDLNAMRLPPNYGETLGVKKVLTTVRVGKPDKAQFFRTRDGDEWVFATYILELKEANETYLVMPNIAPILGSLARPAHLHAAIDRSGNVSLVPVFLPGEDGKWNSWHDSRAQAVELAKTKWLRITSNKSANAYDVLIATGNLPEPVWPETTMKELIVVGFRDKIINSETHPVVLAMLGAV